MGSDDDDDDDDVVMCGTDGLKHNARCADVFLLDLSSNIHTDTHTLAQLSLLSPVAYRIF